MRFATIEMKNYRQYKDVLFSFDKTLDTDLHIIQASNGVGKTNLLNAISWCLYGEEFHMSEDDNKLSICTESVLKEAHENGQSTATVEVVISGSDGKSNVTITRRVKVNTESGNTASRDEFIVEENLPAGGTEFYENESARDRVEAIFPIGIQEYFFFDGEQLLNYFGEKTNTTAIKDSIYSIAQINSIVDAHAHINEIIKKYNKDIGDKQPKLMEVLRKKDDAEASRISKMNDISELKIQISRSKARIIELDKLITGSKDAVQANEQRNTNITKINELLDSKKKVVAQLNKLIRDYTVLLNLYEANKSMLAYIENIDSDSSDTVAIDVDAIRKSVDDHKCSVCERDLSEEIEARLLSILESVGNVKSTKKLGGIKADLKRAINDARKYKEEKEQITSTYMMISDQIDSLMAENEVLSEKVKTCSDIEGVKILMEEKEGHENTILSNTRKLGSYESSLEDIEKRIKSLQSEYDALEAEARIDEQLKKNRDFAKEAEAIIASIEYDMIKEVRDRMESQTMYVFNELMWKKNTYSHVELDDNFKLQLFNMDGKSCFGTCSAAEKELLALAFTIALHDVSGYDNLLFIDTPVGRVSDVNRTNFASVLRDKSLSKQIILAFTPSEYSDEIKDILDDTVISSINFLTSDEANTERK